MKFPLLGLVGRLIFRGFYSVLGITGSRVSLGCEVHLRCEGLGWFHHGSLEKLVFVVILGGFRGDSPSYNLCLSEKNGKLC